MGRPNLGVGHLEKLRGSKLAKARALAQLEVMLGDQSVADACKGLGIRRARFQELREIWLQVGIDAMEPLAPGRPATVVTSEQLEIEALRRENAALAVENAKLRAQLELAPVTAGGRGVIAPPKSRQTAGRPRRTAPA